MNARKSKRHAEPTPEDRWPRTSCAALGLFFLVIGCGLLIIHQIGIQRIANANDWIEVPCQIIERKRKVNSDDLFLPLITYQYEYKGIEYQSRRLKLTVGASGTDENWNYLVFDQHPVGTRTVCYVNPDDPGEAALDREYGLETPSSAVLLGRLFLTIGGILCLVWLFTWPRQAPSPNELSQWTEGVGSPPRQLGLGLILAILFRVPRFVQFAWLCIFVLAVFFNVMQGPSLFRTINADNLVPTSAKIIAAEQDGITLNQPVFRHIFKYQWQGVEYSASSYQWDRPLEIGSQIEILIDPDHPQEASFGKLRVAEIPRWIPALILLVMVLPGLGVVGIALFNFRIVKLMRKGQAKTADFRNEESPPLKVSTHSDSTAKFQLEYLGRIYEIDPRTVIADETQRPCVLFNPTNPRHNVALSSDLLGLVNRQQPLVWQVMKRIAFQSFCCAGLVLLLFYRWFH